MAAGNGRKNRLRIILVVTILSLLLLAPFTVYYLWRTPHSYTKGLTFTPGPMLGLHCKNDNNSHKCPVCIEKVADTLLTPQSVYIDYSRCSLEQPFAVYVYKHDIFPLKYSTDITDLETLLKETNSWTDLPSNACLFLSVVGPSPRGVDISDINDRLYTLPHWSNGVNHILVDIPEIGHALSTTTNVSTVLVANGLWLNDLNTDFTHILVPPVPKSPKPLSPPSLYQGSQTYMLYFEGESEKGVSTTWLDSDVLTKLKFDVKFTCEHADGVLYSGLDQEWGLCTSQDKRLEHCADSKFALVLGASYASAVTYTRIMEALRCGAVPVIIGINRLPFDKVINWNKVAILLPVLLSPHDLSVLLSSFQPETLMEYRRQGRFLHETYFSSRKAVLHTIIAILRLRFMHPPPPALDFNANVFKVNNNHVKIPPSPRFLNNYTIYSESLWNNPPGPFYMYPVTPYRPPYIPVMFNKPADAQPGGLNIPILKGDPFRSSLHGIHPSEGFTVVALTYHRSQHLPEFVKGFEGCPFLAKIVIVWNDEKEPDRDFNLPSIGVPIEV